MNARIAIVVIQTCLMLTACGGGRLGLGSDAKEQSGGSWTPVAAKPSTPSERAVQVGWTAARARYCLFGLDRQKFKADYLAYEKERGATPDQLAKIEQTYDKAFRTFLEAVKEQPNYCTRKRIEEIRPEINRHLAGDYTPSPKKSAEGKE